MIELIIKTVGNKREVPPDVPAGDWFRELGSLACRPDRDKLLAELAWWHPVMELLEPELLIRLQIQALVWRKHTGQWPDEIAWWWPVRQGRRRGQVPSTIEAAESHVDEQGVLHCGCCGARWSDRPNRCKLCDRIIITEGEHVGAVAG